MYIQRFGFGRVFNWCRETTRPTRVLSCNQTGSPSVNTYIEKAVPPSFFLPASFCARPGALLAFAVIFQNQSLSFQKDTAAVEPPRRAASVHQPACSLFSFFCLFLTSCLTFFAKFRVRDTPTYHCLLSLYVSDNQEYLISLLISNDWFGLTERSIEFKCYILHWEKEFELERTPCHRYLDLDFIRFRNRKERNQYQALK